MDWYVVDKKYINYLTQSGFPQTIYGVLMLGGHDDIYNQYFLLYRRHIFII